jgi:hypothetical protein
VIVADKIEELCRLLAQHVPIGDARKRAGITDKQYEKLLEDSKARTRIEAAQRGVMQPSERKDKPVSEALASLTDVKFYEFLTRPDLCALDLSPAVRAIALASDGRPDEIQDDKLCIRLFGCGPDRLPRKPPRVVVLRSGGQCGKTSRLGAPKALHGALTVPAPNVLPGQWARSLITAPDTDLATAALNYCQGYVYNSPVMRAMLSDELSDEDDEENVGTAQRIRFKRHDGCLVELKIKAANRSGTGGRSRSLLSALMDEVCFYLGAEYKVSDAEIFGAIEPRVVPGGQTWLTSSPNIEGYGLLEDLVAAEYGKHETALVVLASTRLMFPGWDPDYEIETPMRKRDPDRARREIDGLPLPASATSFYSPLIIASAESLEIAPTSKVIAKASGGDFAFVNNSSALAIAESYEDGTFAVTHIDEQEPRQGKPLRPSIVCAKHARVLFCAQTFSVVCDGHYRESVREHFGKRRAVCPACGMLVEAPRQGQWVCEIDARDEEELGHGCGFVWTPNNARSVAIYAGPESTNASKPFKALLDGLREGIVKLPNHARLKAQLKAVKGTPRPGVGQDYTITQPEKKNAGPDGTMSHGDLVSAVVLALWRVGLGRQKNKAPLWLDKPCQGERRAY